nr:F-box protein At5g49610-like [Ipomoea batatas]
MFNRNFPIVCGGYPHPDSNSCGFRRLDLGFLPCPDPNHRIEVKGSCADLILCASIPVYYSPSEWKSLVVSSPRPIFARFLVPSTCFLVSYKGMLHMLLANYILVYDPYNCPEKFCRVIDMPTDVEDEKCFTRTLGLSQNRLCVTCRKDLVHPNLDPKIKDTGFAIKDGTYFYWINSSGWSAFRGIVHSITQQWWATPVPPLIHGYTIEKPECGKKLVEKRNNLLVFSVGRRWKQMLSAMPEEERGDEQRRRRTEHRCPEKRGLKRKSDTRIKDYFAPFNSG